MSRNRVGLVLLMFLLFFDLHTEDCHTPFSAHYSLHCSYSGSKTRLGLFYLALSGRSLGSCRLGARRNPLRRGQGVKNDSRKLEQTKEAELEREPIKKRSALVHQSMEFACDSFFSRAFLIPCFGKNAPVCIPSFHIFPLRSFSPTQTAAQEREELEKKRIKGKNGKMEKLTAL